jgi:hypothetical protein
MTNLIPPLGKKDIRLFFESKWPIYELDILDKKGLWLRLQKKLEEFNTKKLLSPIKEEEIINYFDENPDIEFEQCFFDDTMSKLHLFKLNGKTYSYTRGLKSKRSKRKFYVRFYFDLNEFFNF